MLVCVCQIVLWFCVCVHERERERSLLGLLLVSSELLLSQLDKDKSLRNDTQGYTLVSWCFEPSSEGYKICLLSDFKCTQDFVLVTFSPANSAQRIRA